MYTQMWDLCGKTAWYGMLKWKTKVDFNNYNMASYVLIRDRPMLD